MSLFNKLKNLVNTTVNQAVPPIKKPTWPKSANKQKVKVDHSNERMFVETHTPLFTVPVIKIGYKYRDVSYEAITQDDLYTKVTIEEDSIDMGEDVRDAYVVFGDNGECGEISETNMQKFGYFNIELEEANAYITEITGEGKETKAKISVYGPAVIKTYLTGLNFDTEESADYRAIVLTMGEQDYFDLVKAKYEGQDAMELHFNGKKAGYLPKDHVKEAIKWAKAGLIERVKLSDLYKKAGKQYANIEIYLR